MKTKGVEYYEKLQTWKKKEEKQKTIFGTSYPKEKATHFPRNNVASAYPMYILRLLWRALLQNCLGI